MPAEILNIFDLEPSPQQIGKVVKVLKNGGIVVYPTDTVYAMGCDVFQNRAVEKLSQLKGLKVKKNNFSIICRDISEITAYAKVSNVAFKALKKAFPGPYTFILPATNKLPKTLQTNRKTIGVRIPEHPVPMAIVKSLGNPIITTSVKDDVDDILEYPNDIEIIMDQNLHKADLIINGGWSGITPSTVIDATTDQIEVIREGLGLAEFL